MMGSFPYMSSRSGCICSLSLGHSPSSARETLLLSSILIYMLVSGIQPRELDELTPGTYLLFEME